jgi:hypothetical protein
VLLPNFDEGGFFVVGSVGELVAFLTVALMGFFEFVVGFVGLGLFGEDFQHSLIL